MCVSMYFALLRETNNNHEFSLYRKYKKLRGKMFIVVYCKCIIFIKIEGNFTNLTNVFLLTTGCTIFDSLSICHMLALLVVLFSHKVRIGVNK